MSLPDLDKPQTYEELDPSNMRTHLQAFPDECWSAWQKALKFELPHGYRDVDRTLVLGMGGSAIGGDLLRSLAFAEGGCPVSVYRCYDAPPLFDERTLLIGSSYSGNTEETLTAFSSCLAHPARKLVVTSGGDLARMALRNSVPVYYIDYKAPPRAAFPHSFVPLLCIMHSLQLLKDKSSEMAEALATLKRLQAQIHEGVPCHANPAKDLARRLFGKVVLIYGAGILSEVAQRWKGQINENSKGWAFYEVLPEANHNAVVGYEYPAAMRDLAHVVLLHCSSLHPRVKERYRLTEALLAQAGVPNVTLEAKGQTCLAQALSLVLFGDYVSFYLAMLNGTDPTPVRAIDTLKSKLGKLSNS